MSTIEIANCATTSIFLKEILLPLTLNNPFNVSTGRNEDINNAGYNPDKMPITNGARNTGSNTCQRIKIERERCWSEIALSHGNVKYKQTNAIRIAAQVINIDSLRNWHKKSDWCP